MATILFVWELGAGTGHATHAAPIVNGLVRRGHRVLAALRDPSVARGLFDPAIEILPGAVQRDLRVGAKRVTESFAHLLADAAGFDDAESLGAVAGAWRNLLRLVKPDVILFDHAPTVLLAARGLACRKVVFGPGFNCPPDVSPLPSLRPWAKVDVEQLKAVEAPVLDCANRVLRSWGEEPMERLGQLYGEVDDTLLITFAELDCYREQREFGDSEQFAAHRGVSRARPPHPALSPEYRGEGNGLGGDEGEMRPTVTPIDHRSPHYFGPVLGAGGGLAPRWPAGAGPKVYAYLRPFNHLPVLMKLLAERDVPTLVYAPSPGLAAQLGRDFARPTLRIEARPLDLSLVAEECDVAISHAGHGMVCSLLLNGLPALHVPLHTEMGLNARAVRLLGAGVDAPADDAGKLGERLGMVIEGRERFRGGARGFAARHGGFDGMERRGAMLDRIEEVVEPVRAA